MISEQKKKEILDKIRKDMNSRGYILLYVTIMGSHLYGTSSETSDLDIKFIFAPSKDDCILGTNSSNINMNTKGDNERNTSEDVDIQGWSIQFFTSILQRGDTNALDVLYSYSNKEAVLYCDYWFRTFFVENASLLYDLSNLRGLLGYIVTQSEKYGLKGTRYSILRDVHEYLANFYWNTAPKVSVIADTLLEKHGHTLYCKFEKTSDNRNALRICGKVHMYDIGVEELIRRIEDDLRRYGERTKQSLDGSDWKALSHAYRGIVQAKELLCTKALQFPLRDAEQIKNIKMGLTDKTQVSNLITKGLDDVKTLIDSLQCESYKRKTVDGLILKLYNECGGIK